MLEPVNIFICSLGVFFVLAIILIATNIRIVPETQRLIVFRFGRYFGDLGPGVVFLIPLIDKAMLVNLGGLIGDIGDAQNDINLEGLVNVNKQLWAAQSEKPIKAGARVKVVAREGARLTVIEF